MGEIVAVSALSDATAVNVTETVLLACVGLGLPGVDTSWNFNGATLQNSSLVTIYERELIMGRRRYKESLLQICNAAVTDAGIYTCIVTNAYDTINATTELQVIGKNSFSLWRVQGVIMCL